MSAMITPESAWAENRFPNLETVVGRRMWQTPVADDAIQRKDGKWNSRGEPKLSAQVMLPTPTASDSNKWSHQSLEERKDRNQQVRLPTAVSPEGGQGGSLNPTWVEWLMGWPLGWTVLEPLETDKFRAWLHSHSELSRKG